MVGDEEQDEILRVIIYWEWEVKWKALSCVWFFVTTWTKTAHGILHARILEWVAFPLSFPNTGIKLRSPSMQADSLPAEPHLTLIRMFPFSIWKIILYTFRTLSKALKILNDKKLQFFVKKKISIFHIALISQNILGWVNQV